LAGPNWSAHLIGSIFFFFFKNNNKKVNSYAMV